MRSFEQGLSEPSSVNLPMHEAHPHDIEDLDKVFIRLSLVCFNSFNIVLIVL